MSETVAPTNEPQSPLQHGFVHHTDLVPNGWNANTMDPAMFGNLVATLQRDGKITEPLVVIDSGEGKWMIVHGEKRYLAGMEAGIEFFPVIIEQYTPQEAKIRSLAMNNLRGDLDHLRLAHLLVDLYHEYTAEEIAALTGIGKDTQTDALKELEVELPADHGPIVTVDDGDMPEEITILLMPEQMEDFEVAMHRALGLAAGEGIALVGEDREDWTRAIRKAQDLTGMKTRNAALSAILAGFMLLDEEQQDQLKAILDSRGKGAISFAGTSEADDIPL